MDIRSKLKTEFLPAKTHHGGNRNLYLDFLKALAAFLTVFYHFALYRLDYGFTEGVPYYPNLNRILMCFSACCVPLFFVINGALMLGKKRSIKDIYFKATKILILTLLWRFTGFPAWFFRTLFFIYLILPLLQWLYNKHRKIIITLCILILVFPFIYNLGVTAVKAIGIESIGVFGYEIPVSRLSVTGAMTGYSLLYFLMGPYLKDSKGIHPVISILLITIGWAMVVAECSIYTNLNNTMYDGVNIAFPTVGALLLTTGVFTLAKKIPFEKIAKPLGFISGGILHIYLMHVMFIKLFHLLLGGFFSYNLITSYIISAVIFMLCVLAGKLAQKIPVLCWFFKM